MHVLLIVGESHTNKLINYIYAFYIYCDQHVKDGAEHHLNTFHGNRDQMLTICLKQNKGALK